MARDHVLLARRHRSHLIRAGHCARIERIPADAGLPIEHVEYLRRPDPNAAGPTPGESSAGRRSVRRGGGRRTLGSRRAHSRPRWQGANHKRHGERRKTDSHAAWLRQAVGVTVGSMTISYGVPRYSQGSVLMFSSSRIMPVTLWRFQHVEM